MPYTEDHLRQEVEQNGLQDLSNYFVTLPIESAAGVLNQVGYSLVLRWIKLKGRKYFSFAVFIGTLICCVFEIYRRLIAPYEEEKIKDNGDIT